MNLFAQYLRDYLKLISIPRLLTTSFLTGLLIILNYHFGLERGIKAIQPAGLSLVIFFAFYFFLFILAYFVQFFRNKQARITQRKQWLLFTLLASFLFALKMIPWNLYPFVPNQLFYPWNLYSLRLADLLLKLMLISGILFFCWKKYHYPKAFAGLNFSGINLKPYLIASASVLPLIAFAATRPAFLHSYPRFYAINFIDDYTMHSAPWKMLYEITYGLDFFTIEIFFRGFLVLAFIRFAGVNAILPMAAFYCSVHFGKPPAECIMSYFGGIMLGVIAWRSKSIIGGLIIHLWIAYSMECAGWLGHLYFNSR